MNNTILLKIATPFKHEFRGEVSYIKVPTITGEIGILPGHIPIISALGKGIIELHLADKTKVSFEVGNGGFLRFNNNSCVITTTDIKSLVKTA